MFALVSASLMLAQEKEETIPFPTQKGNFMVETTVITTVSTPTTGMSLSMSEGEASVFNVGLTGGYFVANNLALKGGVGYGNTRFEKETLSERWSFRAGMEWSILGYVPIEVAWTGSTTSGEQENPSYLSTQLGYNWFFAENLTFKPFVRYDTSLNTMYKNVTSFGAGFAYFF